MLGRNDDAKDTINRALVKRQDEVAEIQPCFATATSIRLPSV
jgi:hypothetical protein